MNNINRVTDCVTVTVETAFGSLVSGLCRLVEIPATVARPALRALGRAVQRLEPAYNRITYGTRKR